MSAAERIETVGPTKPDAKHPRWRITHVASKLEHTTTGRAQYAYGALVLAIDEGFATRVLDANHAFPTMSGCEFQELVEDEPEVA